MTNKIAIAIIAVLAISIIVPTVYAQQRDVTKEKYEFVCHNILKDDRKQWHEFGCTYFPEIWNWINELLAKTSELETSMNNTQTQVSDHEQRLQVLEGIIPPIDETHPLVVMLIPDSIVEGEEFTVYGHVNRIEQYWVDFTVYDPNENPIQWFSINTLQNGGFYPPAVSPNHNWKMNGTYTIIAEHGIHNATNTIQYTLGQNP